MAEKNQERETQVSEHYRHNLGEAVSDKSAPQQTGVQELSFISRSPAQWQSDRGGLRTTLCLVLKNYFVEIGTRHAAR